MKTEIDLEQLKVLLINSDENDYVFIQKLFSQFGELRYSLDCASTCQDGLETLLNNEHQVCITNYRAGTCNIVEFLCKAQEQGCQIPVIVLTESGAPDIELKILEAGAADCLVKSETTPLLLERAIRYAIQLQLRKIAASEANKFLDVSLDMLCIVGKDGYFKRVNPAWEKTLGFAAEELLSKPFLEFVHPEDKQKTYDETLKLGKRQEILSFENRFLCKDGAYKWLSWKAATMGEPQLVYSVARDVSQRKFEEQSLIESKQQITDILKRLNEAQRIARLGSWEMDVKSKKVFLSEGTYRIIEKMPHEFEPSFEGFLKKVHPDDRQTVKDLVGQSLMNGMSFDFYHRIIISDEIEKIVYERGEVILDDEGKPTRLIGTVQDVTERKQAEEAFQKSETQFRAVFDNSLDAMLIADDTGRYLDANPAACSLFGLPKEEITKRRMMDFAAPGLEKEAEQTWDLFIKLGAKQGEHQLSQAGGKIVQVEYSATANVLPGQHLAILRDVTERKSLEEQLRQSQQLEAVGRLAGGIAHDFNNMLTVINCYSDLILRKLDNENPLRGSIEEIKKAGQRSASLTQQLLAFSRQQILQPKAFNISEIISDTSNMLQLLIGENIQLTIISNDIGQVKADPGQLTQVIVNLAINARDAMPGGGKLLIETANIHFDEKYAAKNIFMKPGSYVMLSISDTGTGMDKKTQQRIFEPFYTTKEVGKGTGLGLATVYGIVKQSDGYIGVYSELGYGTTFKVYLPLIETQSEAEESVIIPVASIKGKETILIVEDEEMVRTLTRQILEDCGYHVLEACNGIHALEICEQSDCKIDLLITDVVMPEMSGRELAEKLEKSYPTMSILFTSGYTDDTVVIHGILETGMNFIQKPFTFDTLAQKVRKVLDESFLRHQ